MIKEESKERTQ